jgi:hypothetical protein
MTVIKAYSKLTDEAVPAEKTASGFVALKGALSRKKGSRVTSEERTEEFNKKVITKYKPGEQPPENEDSETEQEEDPEVLHKISGDANVREVKKAKIARPADKDRGSTDGQGTKETLEPPKEDAIAPSERTTFMNVIAQLTAKNENKPLTSAHQQRGDQRPNKCYAYAQHGSCRYGANCKYSHEGDTSSNQQPYPSQHTRRQSSSPPREATEREKSMLCRDYSMGKCLRGSSCRFDHKDASKNISRGAERQDKRCRNMMEKGTCDINGCNFQHGSWSKDTHLVCDAFSQKRYCPHVWRPEGCRFSHSPADKRSENDHRQPRDSKNGVGRRADGYRK